MKTNSIIKYHENKFMNDLLKLIRRIDGNYEWTTRPLNHQTFKYITWQSQVVKIICFFTIAMNKNIPMNSIVTAHWAQMTTGQAAEQDCCCTSLIIDIEFCHHSVTFCHLGINLELIPTYQFVMTRYMLLNPVSAQNYKRWPSVSVCWNFYE